eukprot:982306-Amphidinium_carterae.1
MQPQRFNAQEVTTKADARRKRKSRIKLQSQISTGEIAPRQSSKPYGKTMAHNLLRVAPAVSQDSLEKSPSCRYNSCGLCLY